MPVAIVGADGEVLHYNEAAAKIAGRPFEKGLKVEEMPSLFQITDMEGTPLPPEDRVTAIALRERRPGHRPMRMRGFDDVWRDVQLTAFPVEGQGGRMLGAVSIFWEGDGSLRHPVASPGQDCDPGQGAELMLARQLASCLVMPIWIVGMDGNVNFYNEPAEDILARRFEEAGPMPLNELAAMYHATDPEGNQLHTDDLPIAIALKQRRPSHRAMRIQGLGRHLAHGRDHGLSARRQEWPHVGGGGAVLGRRRVLRVTLWGTRGSLPSAGPENAKYGGNTACVEVRGADGSLLVLDAGTGIRRLGATVPRDERRIDILLSHLHMDHIQGLGFFQPLYWEEPEVHIWGPPSATMDLRTRLARYLSQPLFPVRLRDLPCQPNLHDTPLDSFEIGSLTISADIVCHPGPTVGYRITKGNVSLAYLPDHEPALGAPSLTSDGHWVSGYDLAFGVDILIHDAQYATDEYAEHLFWGHSTIQQTLDFATATRVKRLVTFHHDPGHTDTDLDRLLEDARNSNKLSFELVPGTEGATLQLVG